MTACGPSVMASSGPAGSAQSVDPLRTSTPQAPKSTQHAKPTATNAPHTSPTVAATHSHLPRPVPFYRLHNTYNHFYTADPNEVKSAEQHGYANEGIVCYLLPSYVPGSAPFYRLHNVNDHLYTTDPKEVASAEQNYGYTYEGIAGYVSTTHVQGTVPLYRLHTVHDHFYTADPKELPTAEQQYHYVYEGIACYVLPK